MARPTRQYICIVDGHRRPSRQRNTFGRYQVAARDPKTARRTLQKAIGFGSVQVYYEEAQPNAVLPPGTCRRQMPDGTLAPVRRYDE